MREIVLKPDVEDGGWNVEVPSLPGCFSQGETVEQAVENARDAIQTWIESARAHGDPIPEETFGSRIVIVDDAPAEATEAA